MSTQELPELGGTQRQIAFQASAPKFVHSTTLSNSATLVEFRVFLLLDRVATQKLESLVYTVFTQLKTDFKLERETFSFLFLFVRVEIVGVGIIGVGIIGVGMYILTQLLYQYQDVTQRSF